LLRLILLPPAVYDGGRLWKTAAMTKLAGEKTNLWRVAINPFSPRHFWTSTSSQNPSASQFFHDELSCFFISY